MICYNYLEVTIDVKSLLDKDIILHCTVKINEVDRKKCFLKVANTINVLICLFCGIIYGISLYLNILGAEPDRISNIRLIPLEFTYSVTWCWALCKLYTQIKSSRYLLPNKRIFLLHGTLLFLYFLFSSI